MRAKRIALLSLRLRWDHAFCRGAVPRSKKWLLACLLAMASAFPGRWAQALTAPTPVQISPTGTVCHDYPDVIVPTYGSLAYAAWTGYDFGADQDEIYLATLNNTTWTTGTGTGITGDLFSPCLGNAGTGGYWIVWSQKAGDNWDLYTRPMLGGAITRLTTDPGADTNVAKAGNPANNRFFVVWQGFRSGRSAIFLMVCDNGTWSAEKVVSQPAANEWFPKAVCDSLGRLWIVWDSYRNGNYDVFLRCYYPDTETFGSEIQVTANPKYEANASIVCDADNRVWLTWETGGANWAKDQGRLVTESRLTMPAGKSFMANRRIAVGVYDGVSVKTTAIPFSKLYPTGFDNTFDPIVAVDANDRAWVFHARRLTFGTGTNSNYAGWQYAMTRYSDSGTTWTWDTAVTIPTSLARVERKMAAARYSNTRMLAVWHVDGRKKSSNANDLRHGTPNGHRIYAGLITVPAAANLDPPLVAPAADAPTTPTHPAESADVAALRAYRAHHSGKTYRVARGDLHRHTDASWDGNGDSSLDDLFRYLYDAASLDFIMPSDHHTQLLCMTGIANPIYSNWNFYPWRRTQKYDDMYYSPGAAIPFFGYERSRSYPDGHRNIVFANRGARSDLLVPSTTTLPLGYDQTYLWNRIKPMGGISIPHTIGDEMGTSWQYDIDFSAEKVLEIYQGCRYSFEDSTTAPVHCPNIDVRGTSTGNEIIRPDGFFFAMLQQRLANGDYKKKYGVISSSDHGSTHLSYACVYVENPTRQGIIDAIQARHTYAAMDNIILDVRCGAAMMGDELVVSSAPTLWIHVEAPKPMNEVAVICDNRVIYSYNPSGDADPRQFEREVTDYACAEGYHYYYVRVRQNDGKIEPDGSRIDGSLAWSSPIWVQRTTPPVGPGSRVGRWYLY